MSCTVAVCLHLYLIEWLIETLVVSWGMWKACNWRPFLGQIQQPRIGWALWVSANSLPSSMNEQHGTPSAQPMPKFFSWKPRAPWCQRRIQLHTKSRQDCDYGKDRQHREELVQTAGARSGDCCQVECAASGTINDLMFVQSIQFIDTVIGPILIILLLFLSIISGCCTAAMPFFIIVYLPFTFSLYIIELAYPAATTRNKNEQIILRNH